MDGTVPPPWVPRAITQVAMNAIKSIAFDVSQELLWVCDAYSGTLRSFTPQHNGREDELQWYAYSATNYHHDECHSLISTPDLVWTGTRDTIRAQKRGGAPMYSLRVPEDKQRRMCGLVHDPRSQSIFFYGETPGIMQASTASGCSPEDIVVHAGDAVPCTCMLVTNDALVNGIPTGDVVLRDPRAEMKSVARMRMDARVCDVCLIPRPGSADADSNQNVAISDGLQVLAVSTSSVRLFDTRNPTVPIARYNPQSPHVAKLIPLPSNEVLLCGKVGVESVAVGPASLTPMYAMNLTSHGLCTSFALSKNRACLCVGTDSAVVQALSHVNSVAVDATSGAVSGTFANSDARTPPAYATPATPSATAKWNDRQEDPIEALGFDAEYTGSLASDWPSPDYMVLAAEGKPLAIPHQVQEMAKTPIDNHLHLTRADTFRSNPKDKLTQFIPNPWPFNDAVGSDPTQVAQQLVELRKQRRKDRQQRSGNLAYSKLDEALQVCYPYGTQPFDWKSVNQSKDLIGLDNSLPESWINPLLHCLFYLQAPNFVIRKTIMRHLCKREECLTCELATLFHNMSVQQFNHSQQPIMQPTNMLRKIRQLPAFVKEGIFEPAKDRDQAVAKFHSLVKTFLREIDKDLRTTTPQNGVLPPDFVSPDFMASVFGTQLQLSNTKQAIAPSFLWEVPASASKVDEGLQHLLKQLERYQGEAVSIRNLPWVLLLLLNPEHGHLRPPPSLKFSRTNEEYNYILTSNILHLADDVDDPGNFVLHARLPDGSGRNDAATATTPAKQDPWVVFNDYCVSGSVASDETLETLIPSSMNHSAIVTCYVLDDFKSRHAREDRYDLYSLAGPVLYDDWSQKRLLSHRVNPERPYMSPCIKPISDLKSIAASDLVAIDAEYIILNWGNEGRSDLPEWVQKNRKPFMSLARVSCVLSKEVGKEQTIIDDYIATNEDVQDYVTQYSGIHPGDLDLKTTPHSLTTLKTAVLKLRCLVDRGVRFVGHGLAQDFRVINLAVPRHRILDTLELYHRKGHRYMSLRFLAYYLLDERVQDGLHDSIEDARTSLRLYRKYTELLQQGRLESTMDDLLQRGADTNWYVPESTTTTANTTPQTLEVSSTAAGTSPIPPAGSEVSPAFPASPASAPAAHPADSPASCETAAPMMGGGEEEDEEESSPTEESGAAAPETAPLADLITE